MDATQNILRVEASARKIESVTRQLTDAVIAHLGRQTDVNVKVRDISEGLPFVTESWVEANFTPDDQRSVSQQNTLSFSGQLINEIKAADTLVIGTPIYNFGIPATLKAWIDQIARVGVTFRYTETGPVGLLQGKRAIVAVASGGTPVGSEIDFATPYLRHALEFMGITEITFISADALSRDMADKIAQAHAEIAHLKAY